MKKPLALLASLLLGSSLFLGSASAVPITTNYSTQTLTNDVGSTGYTFDFSKFDETLGTLVSVTFSIVNSVDSGYFTVTNSATNSAYVRSPHDALDVTDLQGSGADYFGDTITLLTTPGTVTPGNLLPANTSRNYTVTNAPVLASNVITQIDPSFWSSYSSYNGSGLVSFFAAINPGATVTGGNFALSSAGMSANTIMSLTYAYAVPEPSTYALFGLGGLILFVSLRRRTA